MARVESCPQDFLWVNKTIHSSALSNNKGDAASRRSVNKHVQRWRTRSSTIEKLAPDSDGPTVIGWRLDNSSKLKKSSKTLVTPSDEEGRDKWPLALLTGVPPSWGSPVDPFKSSSVPITGEVFGFLRHFIETFLAGAIQTQVQNVLSPGPGKPRSSESMGAMKIVQECVADPKHMYSVLALTSHQLKYVNGHKLPRADGPEFYMAKALEGLRKTLDPDEVNTVSQQVVLDFSFMAAAEAYRENFTGAMAYQQINSFVVRKMGGFEKVEPFVREMCRIGDIFISSLTMTPPICGLFGDPGPISEAFRGEIDKRILPQRRMGAAFLEHQDLWNPIMSDMIADMLDVVQAAQFLWAFPESDVSSEDRDWVLQRNHALTLKFLSMVPTSPVTTFEEAVQESCRLCLILWLFYVLAGTTGIPSEPGTPKRVRNFMPEHTRRLRQSVELADSMDTYARRWGPYEELWVWMAAFGTLSSKIDGCWFALELRDECKSRGIYTYDSLATITSKYLSLDRLEQLSNRMLARTLIVGMMEDYSIVTRVFY
jgi:hypothetical protein